MTEHRIYELEDELTHFIPSKQQRDNRLKNNNLGGFIQQISSIRIIGVPQAIMAYTFQIGERLKGTDPRS